jgi:hypothetical protein
MAGLAQEGRGAFNKTRNQSPEYDYTHFLLISSANPDRLFFRVSRI